MIEVVAQHNLLVVGLAVVKAGANCGREEEVDADRNPSRRKEVSVLCTRWLEIGGGMSNSLPKT